MTPASRTGQILGARLFHVDAQEVKILAVAIAVALALALAMRTGTTATPLKDGIWTHPAPTEVLDETLGELAPPTRAGVSQKCTLATHAPAVMSREGAFLP